jgi:hypothetical protein
MWKQFLLVVVSMPFCLGATCGISCRGDGPSAFICPGVPVQVELDLATCTMRIAQDAGGTDVDVTATITDTWGCPVGLQGGQEVSVNEKAMMGPSNSGAYVQSVPSASKYTITVIEPTRGVETTTVSRPAFSITSPAKGETASLSGFTLSWTNADANLDVTITLTQTIFDETKRETFGPSEDTGSKTFDFEDLADFQQGADLIIEVTRVATQSTINGFKSAELTVVLSRRVTVSPGQ